jgi:S-(hydroxymethyl)glutathione dehydrogenase / alcohol dehydrogenase
VEIRAAVSEEFGAPLGVTEVELDDPAPREVLVRPEACGVCHTDMYTASGAAPSGYAPTVLGREGAGIVEKLGEGVTSVSTGDRVLTLFSPQCRECTHCRSTKTNLRLAIPRAAEQGTSPRRNDAPEQRRRADPSPHGHENGFELMERQDGIRSVIEYR